jgi:hypothetical protein
MCSLQTTRTRGKPAIVGPNMTEKRKNNYNCVLQLASQPSKSWESKDVVFQKMKPKIDEHISSNKLLVSIVFLQFDSQSPSLSSNDSFSILINFFNYFNFSFISFIGCTGFLRLL